MTTVGEEPAGVALRQTLPPMRGASVTQTSTLPNGRTQSTSCTRRVAVPPRGAVVGATKRSGAFTTGEAVGSDSSNVVPPAFDASTRQSSVRPASTSCSV